MHEPWLSQLPYYVAGTLDPAERDALEAHLGACEACRAAAHEWAVIAGAVREDVAGRASALPPLRPPRALSRNGRSDAPSPLDVTSIVTHHTENMEDTPMVAHSTQIAALRPAPPRFGSRATPRSRSALTLIAVALLIAFAGAGALLLADRLGDSSSPAASAPGGESPAGLGAQVNTPTLPPTSTPYPLTSPMTEHLSAAQMTATALIEHRPVTSTPIPQGQGMLLPPTVAFVTPSFVSPANTVPLDYGLPPRAEIEGVRYERQTWNNSGPAALAMALSALGWEGDQAEAAEWLRADADDRSVMLWEMVAFVERQTEYGALHRVGGVPALLKRLVAAGFPVVIPVGFEPESEDWFGHHWLVAGYDDEAQTFLVYDSYLGRGQNDPTAVPYDELDAAWRQFNRAFLVVYRPEDRAEALDELAHYADPSAGYNAALQAALAESATESADPWVTIKDAWAAFNFGASSSVLLDSPSTAAAAFDKAFELGLPWRTLWYRPEPYAAYYAAGRFGAVLRLADEQSEVGFFEEAAYWRGMVFAVQGFPDLARQEFEAVLDANPNYLPAQAARAELELVALGVQVFPVRGMAVIVGPALHTIVGSEGVAPTPVMRGELAVPGVGEGPVVTVEVVPGVPTVSPVTSTPIPATPTPISAN